MCSLSPHTHPLIKVTITIWTTEKWPSLLFLWWQVGPAFICRNPKVWKYTHRGENYSIFERFVASNGALQNDVLFCACTVNQEPRKRLTIKSSFLSFLCHLLQKVTVKPRQSRSASSKSWYLTVCGCKYEFRGSWTWSWPLTSPSSSLALRRSTRSFQSLERSLSMQDGSTKRQNNHLHFLHKDS